MGTALWMTLWTTIRAGTDRIATIPAAAVTMTNFSAAKTRAAARTTTTMMFRQQPTEDDEESVSAARKWASFPARPALSSPMQDAAMLSRTPKAEPIQLIPPGVSVRTHR